MKRLQWVAVLHRFRDQFVVGFETHVEETELFGQVHSEVFRTRSVSLCLGSVFLEWRWEIS